ncbi:MAG: spore coat protein [Clostridia bacterium]|nr:spore coat protein [Clostridia bacterium]MDE5789304.1 spore coat protein [Clostridia bacterium]MDE6075263.1 spore coat protein [Clostridia bacterium]MDE6790380.1 spore coat protein [Clostridia bacterium]MDE7400646.1 spore coat protein [Clostridia bacterium]
MKLTKMNTQLNEKDAIQDMLESEKQLMSFYTTALFEGSSKSLRKSFSTHLNSVAENQYSLFSQMSSRGYYTPTPAQKQMIDQTTETFKKEKKQLEAN